MTTLREAAEAVMEQLTHGWVSEGDPVAQDLRAALAEPVQEPVADKMEEAHDWQYRMAGERLRRIEKLEAQRDALLEALKYHQEQTRPIQKTIDAIKAAEEGA